MHETPQPESLTLPDIPTEIIHHLTLKLLPSSDCGAVVGALRDLNNLQASSKKIAALINKQLLLKDVGHTALAPLLMNLIDGSGQVKTWIDQKNQTKKNGTTPKGTNPSLWLLKTAFKELSSLALLYPHEKLTKALNNTLFLIAGTTHEKHTIDHSFVHEEFDDFPYVNFSHHGQVIACITFEQHGYRQGAKRTYRLETHPITPLHDQQLQLIDTNDGHKPVYLGFDQQGSPVIVGTMRGADIFTYTELQLLKPEHQLFIPANSSPKIDSVWPDKIYGLIEIDPYLFVITGKLTPQEIGKTSKRYIAITRVNNPKKIGVRPDVYFSICKEIEPENAAFLSCALKKDGSIIIGDPYLGNILWHIDQNGKEIISHKRQRK